MGVNCIVELFLIIGMFIPFPDLFELAINNTINMQKSNTIYL